MTALQKSDGQEWIEWNGGVCQVPVETLVMTKLRNGWQSHGPAMAGYHRWDHGRTPDSPLRANDIVAYRVADAGPTVEQDLLDALRALLVFAEAAETKALVGDEGCLWPVEQARAAVARATGQ